MTLEYPTSEIVTYTYDPAWRQGSLCSDLVGVGCYVETSAYNALSQPTSIGLGNNLIETYSYNNVMSRLSSIWACAATLWLIGAFGEHISGRV